MNALVPDQPPAVWDAGRSSDLGRYVTEPVLREWSWPDTVRHNVAQSPDLRCPHPRSPGAPPALLYSLARVRQWHETSGLPAFADASATLPACPRGHRHSANVSCCDHARRLLRTAETEGIWAEAAADANIAELTAQARRLGHTSTSHGPDSAARAWALNQLLRETRHEDVLAGLTGPGAVEAGLRWQGRCAYTLAARYPELTGAASGYVMRAEAEAEQARSSRRGIHPRHVPQARPADPSLDPGARSLSEPDPDPRGNAWTPWCTAHPGPRQPSSPRAAR
ncbi:hypothetical protein AB0P17_24510 [Streptomyces sp. NPDC088124]|uniref:hypothetical protein n=1 Tax=Streptomyces sp. NPDC088124 TaxID=3154654 RepID=UPI0034376580